MPAIRLRAAARANLVDHFVFLVENAGVDTAERFLAQAQACFDDLSRQPMIGVPLTL